MSGVDFYERADGDHGFRVEGDNHEPVASGEGYKELRKAEHGAEVAFTQLLRWMVRRRGADAIGDMVAAAAEEAEAVAAAVDQQADADESAADADGAS